MPSTTSKAPAKASSRTKGGKTYKITMLVKTNGSDTYNNSAKKVLSTITDGYWLNDYFTDWAVSVEPATAEEFEAAL